MSPGAIVGTAIAIGAAVVVAALTVWLLERRRRNRRRFLRKILETDSMEKPPIVGQDVDHKSEVRAPIEVEAFPKMPIEVEAVQGRQPELLTDHDWRVVNNRPWPGYTYEMPGCEVNMTELAGMSRFREGRIS